MPESEVRTGIQRALRLGFSVDPQTVARKLGSGHKISAPDTVPFALWCAAKCFRDFGEAMWTNLVGQATALLRRKFENELPPILSGLDATGIQEGCRKAIDDVLSVPRAG